MNAFDVVKFRNDSKNKYSDVANTLLNALTSLICTLLTLIKTMRVSSVISLTKHICPSDRLY